MSGRVFVCLFIASSLTAGQRDQPEITQQQAPATFSSKVNLVSVPVVVRDSKGRAVGNLRQEDFRLFDKGKPQVITRFAVQTNGAPENKAIIPKSGPGISTAAAPPYSPEKAFPDHYVAYVFDDVHLNFQN